MPDRLNQLAFTANKMRECAIVFLGEMVIGIGWTTTHADATSAAWIDAREESKSSGLDISAARSRILADNEELHETPHGPITRVLAPGEWCDYVNGETVVRGAA